MLVVGTDDWAIEQAANSLVAEGLPVLMCHEPGEAAFPCNALIAGRACPLDDGFDLVATVRARATATPVLAELGAICGLRAGAPLVVAGLATERPFGPWAAATVGQSEDLAEACRDVAAGKGVTAPSPKRSREGAI